MSCTASFVFVILGVGDPAPSPSFLTLWPRPKIRQLPYLHFNEFTVPSWKDFVDGDRDELLVCPIRALQKYFSQTEQYRPHNEGLLISTDMRKKRVSRNTISFWVQSVISFAYSSVSEEDCRALRVRAHEVKKVATSLLFKRNCAVHQVLKAGTWSAQSTFSSFYLRDVTHKICSSLGLWWRLSRSCNPLTLLAPV